VGCNTHVHGSNAKNLSVELSLSQTSNNAMFFLSLVLENKIGEQEVRTGSAWKCGRKVAQIMYTHVNKCKNDKIKLKK
jgi:hypothetical protein